MLFSTKSAGRAGSRRKSVVLARACEPLESRTLFSAGFLDPTFASGVGKRTTNYNATDAATDVAFQSDGTAIVVGVTDHGTALGKDAFVSSYNPDGSVHTQFGNGGTVTLDLAADEIATGVKIQSDGKIVVCGVTENVGAGTGEFFVLRLNADGSRDAAFGTNGVQTVSFGTGLDAAADLVVTPDNHIVVVGEAFQGLTGGIALAFLNPDGSVANTTVTAPGNGVVEGGTAIVQSGTTFYVSGFQATLAANQSVTSKFMIAHFDAGGNLVQSFGTQTGRAFFNFGHPVEFATGIAADPRTGNLVLSGVTADGALDDLVPGLPTPPAPAAASFADFAIARFDPNGNVDATFGGGGVTADFNGNRDAAADLVVMPDGRVLVTGGTQDANGNVDFFTVRDLPDGSKDTTYGPGGSGAAVVDFGAADAAFAIRLQADGLAYVVGATNPSGNAGDVAIARLTNDAPPVSAGPVTVSVGNAQIVEGSAGTKNMTFTVTLSAAAATDVSVDYATAPGTADLTDYDPTQGTLTIPAGSLFGTIDVPVHGDTTPEPDETFTLTLSNPTGGATLANATGTGTIVNDDGVNVGPIHVGPIAITKVPNPFVAGMSKGSITVTVVNTTNTKLPKGKFTVSLGASLTGSPNLGTLVTLGRGTSSSTALKPGKSAKVKIKLNPAKTTATGDYHLVATATGPGITDAATTASISQGTLRISQPLVTLVGTTSGPAVSATHGKKGKMSVAIKNTGSVTAKGKITLSRDVFATGDQGGLRYQFFDQPVSINIKPGKTQVVKVSFTAPKAAPASANDTDFLASGSYTLVTSFKAPSHLSFLNTTDGAAGATTPLQAQTFTLS